MTCVIRGYGLSSSTCRVVGNATHTTTQTCSKHWHWHGHGTKCNRPPGRGHALSVAASGWRVAGLAPRTERASNLQPQCTHPACTPAPRPRLDCARTARALHARPSPRLSYLPHIHSHTPHTREHAHTRSGGARRISPRRSLSTVPRRSLRHSRGHARAQALAAHTDRTARAQHHPHSTRAAPPAQHARSARRTFLAPGVVMGSARCSVRVLQLPSLSRLRHTTARPSFGCSVSPMRVKVVAPPASSGTSLR